LEFQIRGLLVEKPNVTARHCNVNGNGTGNGASDQPSLTTPNARHGSGNRSGLQKQMSPSLRPPRRSNIEMASPFAPELEEEEEETNEKQQEEETNEKQQEEKEEKDQEKEEKQEAESLPSKKQVKVSVITKKEEGDKPADSNNNNNNNNKKKKESGDSNRPVLKAGLKSSRGALKALPREISIAEDDDDEVTKFSLEDDSINSSNSPTFEADKTEMTDAYNAKGLYTGTVSRKYNMPHGMGIMHYHQASNKNNKAYQGDWHLGHWHGKGIIRTAEGDVYTGGVVNDLKEGTGVMVYAGQNTTFNGTFKQDEPVQGTMTYFDNKKYVGQLKNGAWHGKGTLSYADATKYEGEFRNGVQHGKGVYTFSDGSVYKGESVMGAYEGTGKMTWADGGCYEGEWKQGEANGHGMETRPDGSLRHHGDWRKGVPVRT
jgi:hypothetical protein